MSTMAAPPPQANGRSRAFSYTSHHSENSGRNKSIDLKESPTEKRERRLTESTKANPNAAMNELQPIAAALEKPTLAPLRSIQHVDSNGAPIAEPDLSNPTRPRWERPLDTIRSFEAAIDGHYNRRSMVRSDTAPSIMGGYGSRRSSYFGGYDQPGNRYSQASYYGGYYGNGNGRATRDSYLENDYGTNMMAPPPKNRFSQRMAQPGQYQDGYNGHNGQNFYPGENGSGDRIAGTNGYDGYGQRGYDRTPPNQYHNPALDQYHNQNGNNGLPPSPVRGGPVQDPYAPTSPNVPPPVPAHDRSVSHHERKPVIQLGGNGASQPLSPTSGNRAPPVKPPIQSTPSQKKKSWLKRRFSKD